MLFPSSSPSIDDVVSALKGLRIPIMRDEYQLQTKIAESLNEAGIPLQKEYKLGPRMRLDFLIEGGLVIEVKRGLSKPNRTQLESQLCRYAERDETSGFIVVVDRNVHIDSDIRGKPCVVLGLNKLWGIAL